MAEILAATTDSVTAARLDEEIRKEVQRTKGAFIDLFGTHLDTVERVLHVNASHNASALHGLGDTRLYERRMKAIEYAMEHDDGRACATSSLPTSSSSHRRGAARHRRRCTSRSNTVSRSRTTTRRGGLRDRGTAAPDQAPRRQVLRPALDRSSAEPGPGRTPARLDLCQPRPVQLRAAPGGGPLPDPPDPFNELRFVVRGGDGGPHHAEQPPPRPWLDAPWASKPHKRIGPKNQQEQEINRPSAGNRQR